MESSKPSKSGVAIASLIFGVTSFIPGIGVLLGVIAIVLGVVSLSQIKKQGLNGKGSAKAGMILGVLGIIFSVLVYSALFYFGFKSQTGPWAKLRPRVVQQTLTQNAGILELYKKKFGRYPETFENAAKAGFQIFPVDFFTKPFFYKVSDDGQAYELRSVGPDGAYGTADDIIYNPSK